MWSDVVVIDTDPTGQFADVGPPCLRYCDGSLYVVASARHQGLAPEHTEIFESFVDVSGPEPGMWAFPENYSGTPEVNSSQPVVDKHYYPHIFWNEDGKIMWQHYGENISVTHTPHSTSSAPHVVYADGNYHLTWLENNEFGYEINLRSDPFSGGGAFGEGGQSLGDKIKPSLAELSVIPFAKEKFSISYSLPVDTDEGLLRAYDCQGRLIQSWKLETTEGTIEWDCTDIQNRQLSSGVYFIKLSCDKGTKVEKTLLIK
ncbi:hypothetical protein GF359_09425 [candidate division WOR-3 bacterium]|uniref:T9SS type A sorting domain-containing protein n=1 Tax=candidate division WOR-3 bacterium TaxID=2052148 RepID=A0A9D5KC27_UNCW3|nr:hypothetical protein [candidate division WOR-3 bacterium]MBD3365419.1 hypothetical protein [candidate division WOR-3 bacterium]